MMSVGSDNNTESTSIITAYDWMAENEEREEVNYLMLQQLVPLCFMMKR